LIIHSNTEQCFEYLKIQGYQIFVTDFQEDSYTPETAPVDRPVAIVMGTELIGVSETAKKLSDGSIVIPMYGLTQSLNVSVASACVLQRLSTRMREARVGLMSVENQDKLLTIWLQRDQQEKINRRNRHDLARK
jgi:tRNA (guanosine-2'-O-)-methyltransferase